jgi:hypothetical protein
MRVMLMFRSMILWDHPGTRCLVTPKVTYQAWLEFLAHGYCFHSSCHTYFWYFCFSPWCQRKLIMTKVSFWQDVEAFELSYFYANIKLIMRWCQEAIKTCKNTHKEFFGFVSRYICYGRWLHTHVPSCLLVLFICKLMTVYTAPFLWTLWSLYRLFEIWMFYASFVLPLNDYTNQSNLLVNLWMNLMH